MGRYEPDGVLALGDLIGWTDHSLSVSWFFFVCVCDSNHMCKVSMCAGV